MPQIACEQCDQLLSFKPLNLGQKAVCPRCQHTLLRHSNHSLQRSFAFAIAALVLLGFSLYYPFLTFVISGRKTSMSLLQTGGSLMANQEYVLGALVVAFIVLAPLLLIVTLLGLAALHIMRLRWPWAPLLGRIFYEIQHWNMVEVFFLGVLVALVKLTSMASVEIGYSFWTFSGFCVCILIAVNGVNHRQLWLAIRGLRRD